MKMTICEVQNPLAAKDFDTNQEVHEELRNFLGQTEEKVELSDSWTFDSPVDEANPTRTQKASWEKLNRSAKDFPAYMRKVQRKKEKKKNDKIEKLFFF